MSTFVMVTRFDPGAVNSPQALEQLEFEWDDWLAAEAELTPRE